MNVPLARNWTRAGEVVGGGVRSDAPWSGGARPSRYLVVTTPGRVAFLPLLSVTAPSGLVLLTVMRRQATPLIIKDIPVTFTLRA